VLEVKELPPPAIPQAAPATSGKSMIVISVAALAIVGASTLLYTFLQNRAQKRKAQKIFNQRAQMQ